MYCSKPEARDEVVAYLQIELPVEIEYAKLNLKMTRKNGVICVQDQAGL